MPTERTPLTSQDFPPYVYIQSYNRSYRRNVRNFQCCLCAALMAILITALVITVSYAVNDDTVDSGNSTEPKVISPEEITNNTLTTLYTMSFPLNDYTYPDWENPPNRTSIDIATAEGFEALWKREKYEETAPTLLKDSPSFRHQLTMKTLPKARELAETGYVLGVATTNLWTSIKGFRNKNGTQRLPLENLDWLPKDVCESSSVAKKCKRERYRSVDGSCNNLIHPSTWGVALRPFRRILPPNYADGVSKPRQAHDGSPLPSAREVSVTIHRPYYRDDPNFTVILAVWGQFVDHDFTATSLSQSRSGSAISCCFDYIQAGIKSHPECFAVKINRPDPYFEQFNVSCLDFVRSAPAPVCSFGPREQMNQATSFIDGSVIYGASDKLMNSLRTFKGGELKMLVTPDGQELLPISTDPDDGCNQEAELANGRYCFLTGDARANENIHLTTLHLLFARQHNQIARELKRLNPHWKDKRLFEETRKIIGAEMQHITYNEFLPIVLGDALTEQHSLKPVNEGHYSTAYNDSVDPTIANSFAASTFRFGHTLLPGLIRMITNDTNSDEYIETHKMLFNPFKLYDRHFLEDAVRGALNTSIERVDAYFSKQFTEYLFKKESETDRTERLFGLDLVSLNIQRGRDHGLPAYPAWRKVCGFDRPKSFDDLKGIINNESLHDIQNTYKSVDDIDMYTGALAEMSLPGSLVGPTIACLIIDQFSRLQKGDRFWYETSEQPQAFTSEQLSSIKKMTLARLICDTSNITKAQPRVMRRASAENVPTSCLDLPSFDLTPWKEASPRASLGSAIKILTVSEKTSHSVSFSGFVSGGSVTSNGSTIWVGNRLPLTLPNLSLKENGTRWKGYLSIEQPDQIKIWGIYSLKDQKESLWCNGNFAFNIQTSVIPNFNITADLFGTYITKVVFFSNKETVNNATKLWTLEKVNLSDTPQIAGQNFNKSKVILFGRRDHNVFYWDGSVNVLV